MKNLTVKKQDKSEIVVLFKTNKNSPMPHKISGEMLNHFNDFENGEIVNVEDIGLVCIKKELPTFTEDGRLFIII